MESWSVGYTTSLQNWIPKCISSHEATKKYKARNPKAGLMLGERSKQWPNH